jgi:hypothetical protein
MMLGLAPILSLIGSFLGCRERTLEHQDVWWLERSSIRIPGREIDQVDAVASVSAFRMVIISIALA